jgi:hypothetical protein
VTNPQFWPDTPLFTDYLAAAHADHAGHPLFDAACLFSLLQLYANKNNIVFGGRAFRVHFFLLSEAGNKQSAALNFMFGKFFASYQDEIAHNVEQVMYLGGQNTAAGLIDAINNVQDKDKRQVALLWAHDAARLFFSGRHKDDLVSFFDNVLSGLPNVRRVREKVAGGNDGQTVARPIINCVVPARYAQLQETFGGEATLVFKRFMLVAPDGVGGFVHTSSFFDRLCEEGVSPQRMSEAIERFKQFANFLEMYKGSAQEPRRIGITQAAQKLLMTKFREAETSANEYEREYFTDMVEPITLLAGLNALAQSKIVADEGDVERAWAFGKHSFEMSLAVVDKTTDTTMLTPVQKQRSGLIEKIEKVVKRFAKEGVCRTDLRKHVTALRVFDQDELDALFKFIEQEVTAIFGLHVVGMRSNGRPYTAKRYFHTDVWSLEEAVKAVPLEKPHWSSTQCTYIDALGASHAHLADCVGYRAEWELAPTRELETAVATTP